MNSFTVPQTRKLILVALSAVAMAASAAQSQEVDTSAWECEFCPFESGHRGDYELGATSVSDDSAYFGNATGYGEEGVYANVDGEGSYASEHYQSRWLIEDLGLDSRYAELAGGRQGVFDYDLSYREIPRTQFYTTETIFQQSGDTLSLPAGWVRAADTSGFTELDANLVGQNIESERSIFQIGGRYLLSRSLSFSADYRRQTKEGVDIQGGSYFFNSSLLAKPVDYATDEADFNVRYAAKNGYLSMTWFLSKFENNNNSLNWENPFTSAPGSELGAIAQPPGNVFNQLSLNGGYSFQQSRTVVAFSAAAGRMNQNKAFLPYTTNVNVNTGPLPRLSLEGEVNTTNAAFSLNSKVLKKGRIRIAYRYDERDNQTEQDDWTGVAAETFISGTDTNVAYSFKRSTLNLAADYDLFDTVRLSGGFDRRTVDRDFQEVAEQTEDGGWGRILWRPNGYLRFDFKGGAARREIDRYDETLAATLGQNPLMRKYNLAFRYRTYGELIFVASLADSPVTFTLNGLYADDSYTQSLMGLLSGEELSVTGDISWATGPKSSLYLTGGYENIESNQFGSEQFAREDWNATNKDSFVTAGGGFRVREIGGKFDLQLDYTRSEGTSEINVTSLASGSSRFPDLENQMEYLRLLLSYQQSERLAFTMNLRYQSFVAEDWALEGVEPDTIPSILTLGAQPYDDEQVIFGIGFRYTIGGSSQASSN